ncbi:MAG TPA: response regulator [Candidatus Dojkabacteria bacterium]|mgnify:CR=1 FL=1|nr:response regulator [Candidatus Dojkabacteria bacterium]HRO65204.1 response regulator [Candidatus Dojkabacteria bacterium]HRP36664.1 response regulator [Candidatus Dojkabacteria bacterium]HRP51373.1 response regulator [Candidatus Dojkabacteria bacterium]
MEDKRKILVVEDEPDALEIFKDILTEEGFEVDGAEGGLIALERMMNVRYDLVLLDIVMPDKDGISILEEIKKFPDKYGETKVVMLTNIGGDLAVDKAMKIGASGYLLKSETEPDDLVSAVKQYLEIRS